MLANSEGDARAMAAAPDLLAACEACGVLLAKLRPRVGKDAGVLADTLDQCIGAVAKARGYMRTELTPAEESR